MQIIAASDSLCPKGFQCVTAGTAKVTLQVSRGQSASDTLYLCLGDCNLNGANSPFKGDSAVLQRGGASYAAHFKSLQLSGKGWEKTVQQVTIAQASGNPAVTREYVNRWEHHKRIPTPYWRRHLSAVLDIPID